MLDSKDIKFKIDIVNNKIKIECLTTSPEYIYQFSLIKDDMLVDNTSYKSVNHAVFWFAEPGVYRVKIAILDGEQNKSVKYTERYTFEGILKNMKLRNENSKNIFYVFFRSIYRVTKEVWKNKNRMIRVAKYDKKVENKDSYLGKIWDVLYPLIQIGTFWFVFGLGIRGGAPVVVNNKEYAYLLWMLCGLIPWFYVNYGIVRGASSVYGKSGIVLKTKYPLSIIPVGSILLLLYEHLINLVILFLIFFSYGNYPTMYWLNLIYYIIYMIVFLSALALVTSTLTMIARDFNKLINSLIRLLFYLTPILWNTNNLPEIVKTILNGSPIMYIVNGFRDAMLFEVNFYEHPLRILFFWAFALILYMFGCNLQQRFKDKFIDLV